MQYYEYTHGKSSHHSVYIQASQLYSKISYMYILYIAICYRLRLDFNLLVQGASGPSSGLLKKSGSHIQMLAPSNSALEFCGHVTHVLVVPADR